MKAWMRSERGENSGSGEFMLKRSHILNKAYTINSGVILGRGYVYRLFLSGGFWLGSLVHCGLVVI
jgi:hypothetical protein